MGIVIPFERVRKDQSETDEQKRIKDKEAIYRGLIEKEAVRLGKPFQETYDAIVAGHKRNNDRQEKDGIVFSGEEEKLDLHIQSLRLWVEVIAPHQNDGAHLTK